MESNIRCFACDRALRFPTLINWVLVKGEETAVPVGPECYRKVRAHDKDGGYQPPLGGPVLVLIGSRG